MATDLTIEFVRGVPLALQSFEVVIFLAALAGIAFHWWQMNAAVERSDRLHRELPRPEPRSPAGPRTRSSGTAKPGPCCRVWARPSIGQFQRWGLTEAESEVALLQLKGLRHKEIAELRHTSERTVRQQALAVYRKSGTFGPIGSVGVLPRRSSSSTGDRRS
jgi:DNA-binding CsgD family transcriptional regulator